MAAQTHAKVVEYVQQGLHSTREQYLDNLKWFSIDKNTHVIVLQEPAMFIEEGLSPHSMVDDLLRKGAKISQDGSRYKAIPFKHGGPENETPIAQRSLEETLKTEFKKRKIHLTKIERQPDGTPKTGLLHRLDIDSKKTGPTGIPVLKGVAVYQKWWSDRATHKEHTSRDIMTFRVVSDKHKADGRWFHPGLEAKNYMERAFHWAETAWENEILPEILKG